MRKNFPLKKKLLKNTKLLQGQKMRWWGRLWAIWNVWIQSQNLKRLDLNQTKKIKIFGKFSFDTKIRKIMNFQLICRVCLEKSRKLTPICHGTPRYVLTDFIRDQFNVLVSLLKVFKLSNFAQFFISFRSRKTMAFHKKSVNRVWIRWILFMIWKTQSSNQINV